MDAVVQALCRDEVVAIPTDTVYGLAANPASAVAMQRLFELKQRPDGVPVAVLAGSREQAEQLVEPSETFYALAAEHWPGALTLVARRSADLRFYIGDATNQLGIPTVGVRVPDHDLIRACALRFGPIAATSANIHGSPTIVDPSELRSVFGQDVDVIIDAGVLRGVASTVVDVSGPELVTLRQGVVQLTYDK